MMPTGEVRRPRKLADDPITLFETIWKAFRCGHWVRDAPTELGTFGVAARDGGFRGWVEVWTAPNGKLVYQLGAKRSLSPLDVHHGWWWSKPLPMLAGAPIWGER